MNKPKYICEYYNELINSKNPPKLVLKQYEKILEDLKSKKYFYDEKKGEKIIKFIETFATHTKGFNGHLKLELWQKAMLSSIVGLVDEKGLRQFKKVVVVIGRKNGKSLLASSLMLYFAFCEKENGAELHCIAPKLEQADIVFSDFFTMIKNEPSLFSRIKKRRNDIKILHNNGTAKKIAYNEKKADGFNPSLAILDEFSSWIGTKGLNMNEAIASSIGAREQPLIFMISTAGKSLNSVYDEEVNKAELILNKQSDEKRTLAFVYKIDNVDKWDDLEELKKANPNLGISIKKEFLIDEIASAKVSNSKKGEFLTKYCNVKMGASVWLEFEKVEKIADTSNIEDFKNCYAIGGIDLSQTTDLTSACVVIEKNGIEYVFSQFFMPRNKIAELEELEKTPYSLFIKQGLITVSGDNFVDYKDVKKWFDDLKNKLKIYCMYIGYDRYSSQYLIDEMNNSGYKTDYVTQGFNLSPIMKEFEGKVESKKIKICNNVLTRQHILNVACEFDKYCNVCKPVKINKNLHIDGFVAILDALTVKSKYFNEIKYYLKNERS